MTIVSVNYGQVRLFSVQRGHAVSTYNYGHNEKNDIQSQKLRVGYDTFLERERDGSYFKEEEQLTADGQCQHVLEWSVSSGNVKKEGTRTR
jgi:hypothetical protein